MKNIIILLILILTCCCKSYKGGTVKTENLYEVYKLDSINNYFLIYAKKRDSLFKIVSEKEKPSKCRSIKVKSLYSFELQSIRDTAPVINGIKMTPINYMDIHCFQFDENTSICKEEGIYDLYFAKNIKGLCIIK